jgi:hypothetical protein
MRTLIDSASVARVYLGAVMQAQWLGETGPAPVSPRRTR